MAGLRFSMLKSLRSCIIPSLKQTPTSLRSYDSYLKFARIANQSHAKLSYPLVNNNNHKRQLHSTLNPENIQLRAFGFSPGTRCYRTNSVSAFSPTSTKLYSHSSIAFCSGPFLNYRSFSRFFSGKSDKPTGDLDVSATASGGEVDVNNSGIIAGDLIDKVKDVWQIILDGVNYTGEKVKMASDELTPYVQQLLNMHPYLRDVFFPVGGYLIGSILAWVVMPRILRRFHKYAIQGPAALLPGGLLGDQVPYEKSFWVALEDPIRYLVTFMAFVQIGMLVAPTTIASQYLSQAWRGAVILSFVWFLHRWKTNVFTRALSYQSLAGINREKILTLDKLSSVGLLVIGVMALAEACGVAVQSILTVGGIGGVATAFAARDILGNVLSGLSMQFSKPFSLGDTIKAGSIEGQVTEMGLTTTTLLNAEKFPVLVPNSLFSSQVIVNKSRAQWRAMAIKIPLQINDLDKIPQISNDIKSMLRSHANVFLGREAPYCFLSQIESSFAELSLGCNLKSMSKDELYNTEQEIRLQSVKIIKEHGASLGSTYQNFIT